MKRYKNYSGIPDTVYRAPIDHIPIQENSGPTYMDCDGCVVSGDVEEYIGNEHKRATTG